MYEGIGPGSNFTAGVLIIEGKPYDIYIPRNIYNNRNTAKNDYSLAAVPNGSLSLRQFIESIIGGGGGSPSSYFDTLGLYMNDEAASAGGVTLGGGPTGYYINSATGAITKRLI